MEPSLLSSLTRCVAKCENIAGVSIHINKHMHVYVHMYYV